MGQWYPYSTIWEKNIVGILHIYGARPIFLLVCDHQGTEDEAREIEMSTPQPIFTYKKIQNALWGNNIHTLQYGRIILWWLLIFMDLKPCSNFFVITKTLNLSHEKWKLVYLEKYEHRKNQTLYGTMISILHEMGENIVVILHIYGNKIISLLFCNHQYNESESREM